MEYDYYRRRPSQDVFRSIAALKKAFVKILVSRYILVLL